MPTITFGSIFVGPRQITSTSTSTETSSHIFQKLSFVAPTSLLKNSRLLLLQDPFRTTTSLRQTEGIFQEFRKFLPLKFSASKALEITQVTRAMTSPESTTFLVTGKNFTNALRVHSANNEKRGTVETLGDSIAFVTMPTSVTLGLRHLAFKQPNDETPAKMVSVVALVPSLDLPQVTELALLTVGDIGEYLIEGRGFALVEDVKTASGESILSKESGKLELSDTTLVLSGLQKLTEKPGRKTLRMLLKDRFILYFQVEVEPKGT